MKHKAQHPCTRREFLRLAAGFAATAPLAFSGCGGGDNTSPPPPPPVRTDAKVAIVSCQSYGAAVQDSLRQAFDLLGGTSRLVNGKTVTVKINLTNDGSFRDQFGRPAGESYITHGDTALALASLLVSQGARRVRFVDSVGYRTSFAEVLAAAGWNVPALLALGNVELENTRNLGNGTQYAHINVPGSGYMFSYFELNHSYQDTDVFVSLAKLKQHLTAGVTLSSKNVFGSTPNALYGSDAPSEDAVGWRGPMHGEGNIPPLPGLKTGSLPTTADARIPRVVADVVAARPVHLAIIDGITSMSGGEGPWALHGAFTTPHILIAGLNPVSTDAVATAVMGFANPRATRGTPPFAGCDNHLLMAEQNDVGTAVLSDIDVRGLTIQQALYPYPQSF